MSDQSAEKQKIENMRREYSRRELMENDIAEDPIEQFAVWFRQALQADLPDANAMALATANSEAAPSVRIVLLKGFDQSGFRFYTNYESRKGRELGENPKASLCFYWAALERQVRIEGNVQRTSREDSAEYFGQRPRLSQLGAWASQQSSAVATREDLENKFEETEQKFEGEDVPVPDFWGGYLLNPSSIEFWQGRPGRLHDRIVYSRTETGWKIKRLAP